MRLDLVLLLATAAEAYNILAVFPHTGKSHHVMIEPLLRGLAEKGHEVTVVGHYPMKDPPAGYVDVSLAGSMKLNVHACDFDDFLFLKGVGSVLRHAMATYELFDLAARTCDAMSGHGAVVELLASNRTFDLIIAEQFNSDCALGIVGKLKVPAVGIATHVPMPWTRRRFGMPQHPSIVPNHFLKHCRNPSAFEAIESFFAGVYYNFAYYMSTHYLEFGYLKERFGMTRSDLDSASELFSLLLVTTYFPLHGSMPQAPNVIEIGGVHLPETTRPLDKKLQTFLDESPQGVVYVSMGSMIRGNSLPAEKLAEFQRAFAALPFRVLWKWESETMPGKSADVMIEPWTPQFDVLGHPNVAAFVCHGGLLGLTEALHHGVPALVIPFFGDQFLNGAAVRESGLGEVLEYDDANEESLKAVLKRITAPEFSAKVKMLTAIWNDRPQKPLETAIFWIEHVAKFGGKHLRPAAADLSNFRYYMCDVLSALALFVYVLYKTLRLLMRLAYRRNKLKNE